MTAPLGSHEGEAYRVPLRQRGVTWPGASQLRPCRAVAGCGCCRDKCQEDESAFGAHGVAPGPCGVLAKTPLRADPPQHWGLSFPGAPIVTGGRRPFSQSCLPLSEASRSKQQTGGPLCQEGWLQAPCCHCEASCISGTQRWALPGSLAHRTLPFGSLRPTASPQQAYNLITQNHTALLRIAEVQDKQIPR